MTIPASGPLMLSTILTEYGVTPNTPRMLSSLYRGGSVIPDKAANNTTVHLSANVPTSGPMELSDFYGQAVGYKLTISSNGPSEPHLAFGSDAAHSWKKIVEVASGVVVGVANSSTNYGFGMVFHAGTGPFELYNYGEIQGYGGVANSGAGGTAIHVGNDLTIYNYGAIRGGGGGGGVGGAGGAGNTTVRDPASGFYDNGSYYLQDITTYNGEYSEYSFSDIYWAGSRIYRGGVGPSTMSLTVGSYTYLFSRARNHDGQFGYGVWGAGVARQYAAGSSGGAGGAGGRGIGHGQTSAAGSAGAAGGTNAGTGGTGGAGGGWGSAGAKGANGTAGNASAGGAGANGGAAGKAIHKASGSITYAVLGTIYGTRDT